MKRMLSGLEYALVGFAAVLGGAVNALAGGGTLITFPMLTAVGVPSVVANVTNTVALCPGYLGGTLAQAKDLMGQKRRIWLLLPAGVVGGVLGGVLLLSTGEQMFRKLVPYLILLASGLLAVQEPMRNWVIRRARHTGSSIGKEAWTIFPTGLSAVYGGYFGAGLSVIVLAVLGLVLDDNLTRLNALKQLLALVINIAAAVFFLFSGQVLWSVVLVMAVGSLIGGALGGRLAGRIRPTALRRIVVVGGILISLIYFFH
jgi:uncharacterized membrane protein YfcA